MAGLLDGIPSTEVLSITFSGANVQTSNLSGVSFSSISGVNVWLTGSNTNAGGRVFAGAAGSPGLTGMLIQAGSNLTGAGSTVNVPFRTNFAGATLYYMAFTPRVAGANLSAGSYIFFTSGTSADGRRTSGCFVIGPASAEFDWIAVGLG